MTKDFERGNLESSIESENLIAKTPTRISHHEPGNPFRVCLTFEEVDRQIAAITDALRHQLAYLCELMRQLKKEQVNRRHVDAASLRAASST